VRASRRVFVITIIAATTHDDAHALSFVFISLFAVYKYLGHQLHSSYLSQEPLHHSVSTNSLRTKDSQEEQLQFALYFFAKL
jgi:hypothetical protein